jgi:hypothetical protein
MKGKDNRLERRRALARKIRVLLDLRLKLWMRKKTC